MSAERTDLEKKEQARRAKLAKPVEDIKEGLLQVEAFSASEADFNQLSGSPIDAPELAIALSAAYCLGVASMNSQIRFYLNIDEQCPWLKVVDWLDKNVEHFELRFYWCKPDAATIPIDDTKPIFWLIKHGLAEPVKQYLQTELYPPAQ